MGFVRSSLLLARFGHGAKMFMFLLLALPSRAAWLIWAGGVDNAWAWLKEEGAKIPAEHSRSQIPGFEGNSELINHPVRYLDI